MSGMMLHGLGDCTPELNCGCMAKAAPADELRKRIARALWDNRYPGYWREGALWDLARSDADAVIAALRLREVHDGEGHYWQTPWERIEEDG